MGKIRVEELAAQMGIGSKEVLFLLQSIGVDVKSPQAALDEATVTAILQGKTHAPKQLIVRDPEARAFRPQKSALSRIKIVDKVPLRPNEEAEAAPRPAAEARGKSTEPARTAVVEAEPDAEAPKPAAPPPPRRIVLPRVPPRRRRARPPPDRYWGNRAVPPAARLPGRALIAPRTLLLRPAPSPVPAPARARSRTPPLPW